MKSGYIAYFSNYATSKDRTDAINRLKNNKGIWVLTFDFLFDSIVNDFDFSFKGFNAVERTGNRHI